MWCASRPTDDAEEELDLPALDVATRDDELGADGDEDLELPAPGKASEGPDAPIDIGDARLTHFDERDDAGPDDDRAGPSDPTLDDSLTLEIGRGSLLDDGAETTLGDDEAVGIEPMPDGGDRTDADGLDDPVGERAVEQPLPPLDEGDDEAIDVGITLDPDPGAPSTPDGRDAD